MERPPAELEPLELSEKSPDEKISSSLSSSMTAEEWEEWLDGGAWGYTPRKRSVDWDLGLRKREGPLISIVGRVRWFLVDSWRRLRLHLKERF